MVPFLDTLLSLLWSTGNSHIQQDGETIELPSLLNENLQMGMKSRSLHFREVLQINLTTQKFGNH